ncbi:bacteriocin maturation protein [Halobacillus sp. Nhm2S1]|uniref:bacteriocin maturation protein n=1 Tax=Halobacillus sp. Nhm2S1 TaxID=2866716 RepID=UPI001C73C25A|nr:bacteriocin maturation protein [Halobacillus sp. Nhm2S1]MBX0356720.1 bacteriocin maturation protein [Halobacillus sp. Nhm2S1]
MIKVQPSMCLKIKKGTFFMPETDRVYFRNNAGSFQMEGPMIQQWIEKLIPMLDGSHSMESLTDGLPNPYRERLYDITDTLYQNGFLLDVSQERPHELKEQVVEAFVSQIEYLESFVDSPAYHFQKFRQSKVLAIGEGTMVTGLVSAMLQSGLGDVSVFLTDPKKTNVHRLSELETAAKRVDPDVSVNIFVEKESFSWAEEIAPYDAVLYVSQEEKVEELQSIMNHCLENDKGFLSAVVLGAYGIAGPHIDEASQKDWESAWRSLPHPMKKASTLNVSGPAQSMLSTILVFELFKKITGVKDPHQTNHVYLMNMETLEGRWHPFKPHPLATKKISTEKMAPGEERITHNKDQNECLYYFGELAASPFGVFHHWEENDLEQLPLSQCGVQVVHVRSQPLNPEIIAGGRTHEEARREAGLMGVETYVKPLKREILQTSNPHTESSQPVSEDAFSIGSGENQTEACLRALQKAVERNWMIGDHHKVKKARKITLNKIEDEHCRYYWQALQTMDQEPELAISEDSFGFPVVWMRTRRSKWRGAVALHQTLAVRQALFLVLMEQQNRGLPSAYSFLSCSQLYFENESMDSFDLASMEANDNQEVLHRAVTQLEKRQCRPCFLKISMDPFEADGMIHLCGVWMEREDSR